MPLQKFDKIIYAGPKPLPQYTLSWLSRAKVWFSSGKTPGLKSGKLQPRKYAPENISVIMKEVLLATKERGPRLKRDLEILNNLPTKGFEGELIFLTGKKEIPFIKPVKTKKSHRK